MPRKKKKKKERFTQHVRMSATRFEELGAFENDQNIRFPNQKGSLNPNTYFGNRTVTPLTEKSTCSGHKCSAGDPEERARGRKAP